MLHEVPDTSGRPRLHPAHPLPFPGDFLPLSAEEEQVQRELRMSLVYSDDSFEIIGLFEPDGRRSHDPHFGRTHPHPSRPACPQCSRGGASGGVVIPAVDALEVAGHGAGVPGPAAGSAIETVFPAPPRRTEPATAAGAAGVGVRVTTFLMNSTAVLPQPRTSRSI
ncbi:hypothetical protein [Kitasatospora purpeofusca]|uniref:hypothetical protein n=1 Tax=Kitasatospora purpeofusca TaxID=67352 RepID=UPI0038114DD8